MATVRKALPEDFNKTYPLLETLNNVSLKKEDWEQLFVNPWNNLEDYCGYILTDADEVVGYLGMLFNTRIIHGQEYKFCNITSWFVEREYRNQSFLLLLPLLALREYTITIFSANEATYIASKKLGFEDFETHIRLISPFVGVRGFLGNCSIVEDDRVINQSLDEECLKIYRDHLCFRCIHLLIKTKYGTFYLITTRVTRKSIPAAQIHYISDLDVFLESIEIIKLKICLKLKVFMLLIDERFIQGNKISFSLRIKLPQPRVFKSDLLKEDAIDSLYSELIILNL